MTTQQFMASKATHTRIPEVQETFSKTNRFTVAVLNNFKVEPLMSLEEYRATLGTIASLLAAFASISAQAAGQLSRWTPMYVLAPVSDEELMDSAAAADSNLSILLALELSLFFWNETMHHLKNRRLVAKAFDQLTKMAFWPQENPVSLTALPLVKALTARTTEAMAVAKAKFGVTPANQPNIDKLLDALRNNTTLIVLDLA